MNILKNTKTMENLKKAFAGESQARTRYIFYASVANKEGYKQIEAIFIETAYNEKEKDELLKQIGQLSYEVSWLKKKSGRL